jgi:hypothetical protein
MRELVFYPLFTLYRTTVYRYGFIQGNRRPEFASECEWMAR